MVCRVVDHEAVSGGFAIRTPGGKVRIDELPLEVLDEVERERGVRWPTLIAAPASSAAAALALYKHACKYKGADPEQLTARKILDGGIFEQVEDDLPTVFEDGAPDPKAEDGIPTLGSSGDSADGDGLPT